MTVFLNHPIPRDKVVWSGYSCDTFLCKWSNFLFFSMKSLQFLPHRWASLSIDLRKSNTCRFFFNWSHKGTHSALRHTPIKVPLTPAGNSHVYPSSAVLSNDTSPSFKPSVSLLLPRPSVSPLSGTVWGSDEPRIPFFCWSLFCSLTSTRSTFPFVRLVALHLMPGPSPWDRDGLCSRLMPWPAFLLATTDKIK